MNSPNPRQTTQRAAALVIVLAFVVLLAGLVVAYLSRTTIDRQLAHGGFSENRADVLARSATDVVVGDLKQEIVNGSTVSYDNNGNNAIYTPTSFANMVPMLSGTPSPTPRPSSNMVRRSLRSDPIALPGVGSRASAVNSTTDVSLNGRFITAARWNKHYLIPRLNASSSVVDSTPVATFTAPDWVLVTRNGPAAFSGWNASIKNATPTNTSYVVGRYAYAIYDEGGLLDVNVAGFPSPAPSPSTYVQTIGRKGSLAYADLTSLPTSTASPAPTFPPARVNQIVGWRNYASAQPAGSIVSNTYSFNATSAQNFMTNFVANNTGFMTVSNTTFNGATDQVFATRQQLLAFRTATGDAGFSQNALQYLGTFSRELNRPSWTPSTPAGSTIDYAGQANNAAAINRNLSRVRVNTGAGFTRADGTVAVAGESLLKERFSLTRINGLGPAGVVTSGNSTLINGVLSPASAATVQRDFGLIWNAANSRWNYVGATGSAIQTAIKSLNQVAAANREPNFFEILKAVILSGSVGLGTSGSTFVAAESKYFDPTNNFSGDLQIMQIGANIIDTWDTDNVPTFIAFRDPTTSTIYELAGIENLPYLNKLALIFIISNHGLGDTFNSWLVPSLWNPHQNAGLATGDVRFAMTSGITNAVIGNPYPTNYPAPAPVTGTATDPYIQVRANAFLVPSPPIPSPTPGYNETGKSGGSNISTPEGTVYDGLFFGTIADAFGGGNDWKNVSAVFPTFTADAGSNLPTFQMQVLVNGSWKPYQQWKGCAQSTPTPIWCSGIHPASHWKQRTFQDPEFVSLDPRTVRFGVWASDANDTGNSNDYDSGLQDSMDQSGGLELISGLKPQPTTTSFPSSSGTNYYLYAQNATNNEQYADLDGVKRRADWTTDSTGTATKKTIMYASPTPAPTPINSQDRPRVLSQPFQSVAELGQVFRDQPWKTLNFSTSNSGDAGLLDAFTLQDAAMVAGRTSLNTRQPPVLTAILTQATKNFAAGQAVGSTSPNNGPALTATDIGVIISRLTALTAANPMINKAELVTRLMEDTTITPTMTAALWTKSATNPYNKETRESVIRALSDSTQTRTWNLMIDVIAQSGKYPPNATSLANFVVEGEKRYWLHVAIDRFTGEVIDQQLEAVYE